MLIRAPESMLPHVNKVLQGEYDLPYNAINPVVVDLGANVGGFAAWALDRWPGSVIHCYEPLSSNFALLSDNLKEVIGTRVTVNNVAVGNPGNTRLYLGRNNCGEASFYDLGEQAQDFEDVNTISPSDLPKGQVLKLDTEGSELDILSRMADIDYDVILMEFHGDANRRRVDQILANYVLIGGQITGPHRGILKYCHKRLLGEDPSAVIEPGQAEAAPARTETPVVEAAAPVEPAPIETEAPSDSAETAAKPRRRGKKAD